MDSEDAQDTASRQSVVFSPDGIRLAVSERGSNHDETIVMIHGYPDDARVWDPVASVLAEQYRVITYDVRGAGDSDAPNSNEGYRLDRLLDDFLAVLDEVSPGRPVHLVGHDWGSIQGWDFVCSERTAGRILSFSSISGPPLDHVGLWIRGRARPAPTGLDLARQAARSTYVALFHIPVVTPLLWRTLIWRAWPAFLRRSEGVPTDANWPAHRLGENASNGVGLYRANVLPRLTSPRALHTDVPTQLIIPMDDSYVGEAMVEGLVGADGVAKGTIRRVAGTHWLIRRDPREVADWITEHVEASRNGQD